MMNLIKISKMIINLINYLKMLFILLVIITFILNNLLGIGFTYNYNSIYYIPIFIILISLAQISLIISLYKNSGLNNKLIIFSLLHLLLIGAIFFFGQLTGMILYLIFKNQIVINFNSFLIGTFLDFFITIPLFLIISMIIINKLI